MFIYVTLANIAISNALNWFGHSVGRVGYRNYDLRDSSANNPIMAALSFGEGWHNNHHRWPGSANFGVKKNEFDISYQVIKILEKLNIVRNVRTHREI
jgi:stearoyl-CoA desaturase (delta-9 desaturase)